MVRVVVRGVRDKNIGGLLLPNEFSDVCDNRLPRIRCLWVVGGLVRVFMRAREGRLVVALLLPVLLPE
jgi:hypothetical protein